MKNTSLFAILVLAATTAFGFVGQVGAEDDLEKLLMEDPNESLGALGSPALDSPLSQLPTADTSAPDAALPTPTSAPRQSTPDPIETKENDVVVRNASVVIPKGEGYEAIISANGQGLLVELGLCEKDAAGNLVVDEKTGETKRRTLARGLTVKKGDVLGKQKDTELVQEKIVAEKQLQVALKEAAKTLEVEVAEAAAKTAQESYKRASSLNEKGVKGTITEEELAEKYYEWVRASKSVAKAKFDLEVSQEKVEVSKAQLNAAEVQIENRKLVSPIDGFIDDVLANEGEWLREGDKVLRIIRLDKVQINGNVDAERYAPEEIDGKPATVYVKRPGAAVQTLPGKIVYVRQVVESGRYYFYADVQNAKNASGYWALNPGAMVTIVIHR